MWFIFVRLLLFVILFFAMGFTGAVANGQGSYRLAAGDVLGVFVEGVVGEIDSSPPVQLPAAESDLPPSIGFPTVVRQDGTLSLPLVKPISVQGLRIEQAEQAVKRAYRGGESPIVAADSRIIVTLARKRTVQVTVIRQDAISNRPINFRGGVTDRSDSSARGNRLQLPAGDNDLLTALIETGGIPGVNAKPYIRISREQQGGTFSPRRSNAQPSRSAISRGSQFPRTRRTGGQRSTVSSTPPRGVRNHASFYRGYTGAERTEFFVPLSPQAGQTTAQGDRLKSLRLADGDIVHVDARPTEVYYTGGLLRGGEFPLPRDKQLDVLEAVALAGGQIGTNGGVAAGSVPPTELLVVRKPPGRSQRTFRVDLDRAINDSRYRPAVAAGDTLILRYKPGERAANAGIQVFNTFGTRQIFGQ
ncbi:polysaccharide biosynthesis/export family protein [Mariniblastus sp.]|nr:polysaccharide biosynthesis/export family protein [Mariniblastus sp.]